MKSEFVKRLFWFFVIGVDDKSPFESINEEFSSLKLRREIETILPLKEKNAEFFLQQYKEALARHPLPYSPCSLFGGLQTEWEIHAVCLLFLNLSAEEWQLYIELMRPLANSCSWVSKSTQDSSIRKILQGIKGMFDQCSPVNRRHILDILCCISFSALEEFCAQLKRSPLVYLNFTDSTNEEIYHTKLHMAIQHLFPDFFEDGAAVAKWNAYSPGFPNSILTKTYRQELQLTITLAWMFQWSSLRFQDEMQKLYQKYLPKQQQEKQNQPPILLTKYPPNPVVARVKPNRQRRNSVEQVLGEDDDPHIPMAVRQLLPQEHSVVPFETDLACTFVYSKSNIPVLQCSFTPKELSNDLFSHSYGSMEISEQNRKSL